MKILLIATRDIDGPQTGRKLVLRTILRSCAALGHHVDVAVVGAPGSAARYMRISAPRWAAVCANFVWHFLFGRKSLNECLYWSRPAQNQISRLVAGGSYELVVADMVRTAQFCSRLRVPWVLDLDDLLSERYARLADMRDCRTLLGYFSERLPASLRRAATLLARSLLRVEAHRIASQEVYFGQHADAVTLVSSVEAGKLSRQLGRVVHDTAMGIDIAGSTAVDHAGRQRHAVVFIGGLDYQPNLDAVTYYLDHIAPELERLGCAIALHVIGNAPVDLRPKDPRGRAVYLGYVDNLASAIGRYSVFVGPIVTGGGIKTKVLEAMANGLAVVATEQAVAGLGITANVQCLVTRNASEFALAVAQLVNDVETCKRLGRAAQSFVRSNYSHAVLQEKWRVLLDDAMGHFQASQPAPLEGATAPNYRF